MSFISWHRNLAGDWGGSYMAQVVEVFVRPSKGSITATHGAQNCGPTSRSQKKSRNFFVLIFIALFCSLPAGLAQVLYGTMTGTITDTSGAVVAGAQVTTLEAQTGVRQSDTTDA